MHKIVFIGKSGSGKTSIINRLTNVDDPLNTGKTYGTSIYTLYYNGCTYQLWDIADTLVNKNLRPMYYNSARGAVIVLEADDIDIDYIEKELTELYYNNIDIPVVIMINKFDLSDSIEVGKLDNIGIRYYMVSAKTNYGILDAFNYLISHIKHPEILNQSPLINRRVCCVIS